MHRLSAELTHWIQRGVGLADLYLGAVELASHPDRDELFAATLQDREEREQFIAIRNPVRRRSRMGGRFAAYEALRHYSGCDSDNWTIRNNEKGAPYLPEYSEVHLSITHSPDYAIAAAGARAVGIDAEKIEKRPDSLLRYFFSVSEQQWILREGRAAGSERLHVLWSRKEAVSKLLGKGGQLPFKALAVIGETSPYHLESRNLEDHVFSIAWYRDGMSPS